MKTATTIYVAVTLLLLHLTSTNAVPTIQKRNDCTFDPDPDCLPNFTFTKTNATFEVLRPWSAIGTYNDLIYTGFRAVAQLGPASPQHRAHLLPISGDMTARAYRSSTLANSTRITSAGTIMKFKSFSFGCQALDNPTPVTCDLDVGAYNPAGDPSTPVDTLHLQYVPEPLDGDIGDGDACMTTIDEATLSELQPANYYVFTTSSTVQYQEYQEEMPRLVLDDVDAVIYQYFYGGSGPSHRPNERHRP